MAECDGKIETFNVDFEPGRYGSNPFDEDSSWEKGQAIVGFLDRFIPRDAEGSVVCRAPCEEGNKTCLPRILKASVPNGTFQMKEIDREQRPQPNPPCIIKIYYLKITSQCEVKFTVECHCVPFPG